MAGTITFNDVWYDIMHVYYNKSGTNTYTQLAAASVKNINLFDTTSAVGDSIVFASNNTYGKVNQLKINLDIGISATSISGVWEYSYGTSYPPTWKELPNVVDNSNNLRNTGESIISFDPPDDWSNYYSTTYFATTYLFGIRFRITEVTGITSGAHIINSSNACVSCPYSIYINGYDNNTPCTFTDIYNADSTNGWNLITKIKNSFLFKCNLAIGNISTCYIRSINEVIQFDYNWFINDYSGRSTWLVGNIYKENKVINGSSFIFYGQGRIDYPSYFIGDYSVICNSSFRHITNIGTTIIGYWGGGIGTRSNQSLYDTYFEGFRQLNFSNQTNFISDIKFYGGHIETPGAICNNITCYGGTHSIRTSGGSGFYCHNFDVSGCINSPINPYWSTNISLFRFYGVDFKWGTFADSNKVRWTNGPSPIANGDHKIYETYSFLLKLVDSTGDPIENAKVTLLDKDENIVFNYLTNSNGYCYRECGSITSCDSTSITDNTKTWTSNKYAYQEIYLTSGNGIDQRRFIKAYGGTSTLLPIAPDFSIIPANNDNYIIIPYVNVKYYTPLSYTAGNACFSNVTNLNPFTLIITKENYNTYKSQITINKPIDIMMVLTGKTSGIRLSGMRA